MYIHTYTCICVYTYHMTIHIYIYIYDIYAVLHAAHGRVAGPWC